jgi:FixJ family two-component response regulator
MPGVDELKLQEEPHETLPHLSIVFITGHGNVPMSVEAMKGGAVDFLEKPVDGEALLAAIHRAADRSHALRASREELIVIERRYRRMTPRERQVFTLVTTGLLNKQIAFDLGVKVIEAERWKIYGGRFTRPVGTHGALIGCSRGQGTCLSCVLRA